MGVVASLIGLQAGMQMYGQYQAGKQQEAMYNAQAEAAQQNASIVSKQREQQAEAYAQQQSRLNDKLKIARGQAIASAGASGISNTGSVTDALGSMEDAHQKDSMTLLQNQRNDNWSAYVKEVNFRNQANAYNAAAHNARTAAKQQMLGTLIGGAASIYGNMDKRPKDAMPKDEWYNQGFQKMQLNRNPMANVNYGLDLVSGNRVAGYNNSIWPPKQPKKYFEY